MPKTVILGAARTPIGKLGGGLASLDATELGGVAIEAALQRADVAPEEVQHVVMGQVIQAGQGQIPSRQAPLQGARFGFRMGDAKAIDAMIKDGLTNPFSGKHMAQEASEVAAELEMTRPDMDRWALRSHELAI